MRQPIQPLRRDEHGVIRFQDNKIVRHLLDNGDIDLHDLAMIEFSRADREHFAQLIGYSFSGWGDLSYVRKKTYRKAYEHFKRFREES